ncbi:hypothetical protein JOM56_011204 [Amanita muscaria]
MKVLLNFLILILAFGVIAKPLPEECTDVTSSDSVDVEGDSSYSIATEGVEAMESSADTSDADPTDDSAVVEERAIIEGLLSPRSILSSVIEGHTIDSVQPQGTFDVLSKQLTQLSTASSSLGKSVSGLSSNPSFASIYAVTLQLNAFTRVLISSAATVKDLKPMTSSRDATKAVALVRPMMASLTTMVQGFVKNHTVLTSLGIGCIFEELLAFLLILILYLLELLLFLCKINVSCVKELTKYQNDVKTGMKAAIAGFTTNANKRLL